MKHSNIVYLSVMKKIIIGLLVTLASCSGIDTLEDNSNDKMIWVKIDMRKEPRDDSIGVWHCGQIAFAELNKMRHGEKVELLTLKNVRYWSGKQVEIYEDEEEYGEYIFDPALIVKMSMLKQDPIAYEPDSLLSERALAYKAENYK